MVRLVLVLALLLPATVQAEERRVGLGSFVRVRIEGAFAVSVTTGASPGATVSSAGDLSQVDLRTEGSTLVLRRSTTGRWGESGADGSAPVRVTLATPTLSAVSVAGGAEVSITRMTGARVEVSLGGPGAIRVAAVDGDDLIAQLVGGGTIAVAGRVGRARLLASGPGTIDAAKLEAGDLTVHLDGLGRIDGRARYTAQMSNTGLGTVTIAGRPKCRTIGQASGTMRCGTGE